MLTDDDLKKLKGLLEDQHEWPTDYIFKFIVPKAKANELAALFPMDPSTTRPSRLGNYISMTIKIRLDTADLVIAIYQKASAIKGLIAL